MITHLFLEAHLTHSLFALLAPILMGREAVELFEGGSMWIVSEASKCLEERHVDGTLACWEVGISTGRMAVVFLFG